MNARLAKPIVCVITRVRGRRGSVERDALLARLAAAARAGATMVQVRERQVEDRELLDFVRDVIGAVRPAGAIVIVNDRTDVALAARAEGVHLKSHAPPAADVRRIVPESFIIGRSVHSDVEARAVEVARGCDYLFFGTVFPTASKPSGHSIAGPGALAAACRSVQLPIVAIGGVSPQRAAAVREAGAAGAAAISLFAEAADIGAAVGALRVALTPPQAHE